MVEKTLQEMRKGGIFDHIGYGFHRYSTDKRWLVPHFEKMLYDNALLAMAYTETYQATKKLEYKQTAEQIFDYILRDMISPEGAFYSAEDADSEGEEGKFYTWNDEELNLILDPGDSKMFELVYNIKPNGNYIEESTGKFTGKNIPHLTHTLEKIAEKQNIDLEQLKKNIKKIRDELFKFRENRSRPHLDDKILTDWNSLMIAALAKAAYVFRQEKYKVAAEDAIKFILENLKDENGELLHRYREGSAEIKAFLDDYSFLIWALIELYEVTLDSKYLIQAISLEEKQTELFWDKEIGGFYFSAENNRDLITRQKEIYDGALPSGNSVAMLNLLRLFQITGNPEYETKADEISRVFAENVKISPSAHAFLMIAVDFAIGPTFSLVISGDSGEKDTMKMLNSIKNEFLPNKTLLHRATEENPPSIDKIANYVGFFDKYLDKATAYVCVNKTCKPPTNEVEKMIEYLNPIRN